MLRNFNAMTNKEKIEFVDNVLVNSFQWKVNLKNILLHRIRKAMPEAVDLGICDYSLGNDYVCVIYNDNTIHSLYEIKDIFVIDMLYDICLFIKED